MPYDIHRKALLSKPGVSMRRFIFLFLMVSVSTYADTIDHFINIANNIPQMEMKADPQSQAWARSARLPSFASRCSTCVKKSPICRVLSVCRSRRTSPSWVFYSAAI